MPAPPSPGRRPEGGTKPPPRQQPPRPAPLAGAALRRTVDKWNKDNLTVRHTWEIEQALTVVCRHPDAYSMGYSAASNARQRLTTELANRVTHKLNNPL